MMVVSGLSISILFLILHAAIPPFSFQKIKLVLMVMLPSCIILADIISAVEFDETGHYLATGDKGGRVVLFERNDAVRFIYPFFCSNNGFPC